MAGFLAVALIAGWLSRDTEESPCPSTYSRGPYGAAGFYELLGRLSLPCGRWREPSPPEGARTLVLAMPTRLHIERDEARALVDWVGEGGTLLLLFDGSGLGAAMRYKGAAQPFQFDLDSELAGRLGVSARPSFVRKGRSASAVLPAVLGLEGPPNLMTVDASITTAANAGAPRLAIEESASDLTPGGSATFVPLYVRSNRPYAAEVPYGRGEVIIVASAAPIQNARILAADNLSFALDLARMASKTNGIWFDEYYQGYGPVLGFGAVARTRAFVGLAILAGAAMLLFVISKGRRFGPARPPVHYSRRHVLEYVHSVAGLYKRAAHRYFAASMLFRALARRLTRSSGTVQVAGRGERVAFRGPFAQRMADLSARVEGSIASDAQLVEIVTAMDELEREAMGRKDA